MKMRTLLSLLPRRRHGGASGGGGSSTAARWGRYQIASGTLLGIVSRATSHTADDARGECLFGNLRWSAVQWPHSLVRLHGTIKIVFKTCPAVAWLAVTPCFSSAGHAPFNPTCWM